MEVAPVAQDLEQQWAEGPFPHPTVGPTFQQTEAGPGSECFPGDGLFCDRGLIQPPLGTSLCPVFGSHCCLSAHQMCF